MLKLPFKEIRKLCSALAKTPLTLIALAVISIILAAIFISPEFKDATLPSMVMFGAICLAGMYFAEKLFSKYCATAEKLKRTEHR